MSALAGLAGAIIENQTPAAFGVLGSGPTLTVVDATIRGGIPFYPVHCEAAAGIMAGVVGRLSGRPGVALSIKGPGLANMLPGLAACYFESWPVVALSEAYPPGTSPAKQHKRMDQGLLTGAVSKGRRFISKQGPGFKELAGWSLAECPGPVLLEIADEAIESAEGVPVGQAAPGSDEVVRLVSQSRRPVLIVGTLGFRSNLSSRLAGMKIPVFSTAAAKGVVDETLPQAAGVFTGVGLAMVPEATLLAQADLIVCIGVRSNEVLGAAPFPVPSVSIDPMGEALSPGFKHAATSGLASLESVLASLEGASWGLDELSEILSRLDRHLLERPFLPAQVFRAVESRFKGAARLVLDTGYFCTIGEHAWRARKSEWCLGSGQGRYMGIAIPTGIGAALYDRSVPTVVTVGDGGIGTFVAELKLAVEHRLPLLLLLLSDGGYGSVRTRAIAKGLVQEPLLMRHPSWLGPLGGLGIAGTRVETRTALESALNAWNPESGPGFIEVGFEPGAYQEMVRGIRG